MQWIKFIIWLLIAGCFVFFGACGGEQKNSTDSTAGTVQLALTSSVDPVPTGIVNLDPTVVNPDPTDVMSLNPTEIVISIKEIRAVPAGEEGAEEAELPLIVAYDTPKVVNLLDLGFLQELLGEAVLPAGAYTQLRLVLEANADPLAPANYLTLADDFAKKIPLNTPSGQESGLKIVGGFAIESGEAAALVLDFDPARAVVQAGQSGSWQLKPTGIRVVQNNSVLPSYGALVGQVEMGITGEDGTLTRTPAIGARVFAVPQGGDTAVATGIISWEDGSFRLLLPAGSYELQVTAAGFQPFSSLPALFEVIEGEDTDAGTILLDEAPAQ